MVGELERSKREVENNIVKKEKDIFQLANKLDDEQSLVAKMQKNIKELQGRVEELEEELEAERQARAKAERQRSDLAREIEQLGERLNEAGGATHAQIELNKKRESEVNKLRKDIEEVNIQQESVLSNLKRKHQDAIQEMTEQIEQLQKMKSKIEKDKTHILNEIADARAATDEVMRAHSSADKSNRNLQATLTELAKKMAEANLTLSDFEAVKRKIAAENADLIRVVGDLDTNLNMLLKAKAAMAANLHEVKANADNESRERSLLLGKFRNLEHEVDGAKEALDEEAASRDNVNRQVAKAQADANLWRAKYETDAVAKAEELEMTKMKLVARLTEAEGTIYNQNAKLAQIEKSKAKLQNEMDNMLSNLDQAQILNNSMEKKAKQFDRIVSEWKHKVDSLGMDLDGSQKDCRNASSELFKVKSAYEETVLQLDEVRRENKSLSNEIKDIMDQISEGGRSIHEIDKIRKRLEAEKLELESALSEAEGALEQEENKVLRAQIELTQVRQEIEKRLADKDEEFASTKKNMAKGLEGLQNALEAETRAKTEALRLKKKLESDVLDLETALDHANAANMETQKSIKGIQLRLREVQARLEDENRAKEVARDNLMAADRKAHSNQNALEEARTMLEQLDRNRRTIEHELQDTNANLGEQTCANQAITSAKQKCEHEINTLNHDLNEMTAEAQVSEEKAQRAMIDAARTGDAVYTSNSYNVIEDNCSDDGDRWGRAVVEVYTSRVAR